MRVLCVVLLLAAPGLPSRLSHTPSHSYPHSTGYSGASHSYPQSTGHSGASHSYPQSTGLSGNTGYNRRNYNHHQYAPINAHASKTEVHHHYHYSPPQRITYGSVSHPVYHGSPPVYVYEYRDSGSRFDNLLTGLALYNLGRMSANTHHYDSRQYVSTPGEICKLGVSRSTGEYEETRIDCKLMSSFIWEASPPVDRMDSTKTATKTITTVTNTSSSGNNSVTSVTVTSTVTDALDSKGPSIKVTPGMTCFMIRWTSYSTLKKNVECGLLQEYAMSSMRRSHSETIKPAIWILSIIVLHFYLSCHVI